MLRFYILLISLCISQFLEAQRIDAYSTLFVIQDSSYVRISYDNDLFQGHDIYYTQGVSLELVFPKFSKNPLNKILIPIKNSSNTKNGIRIETAAFTPTSILSDSILYNDRPYAAMTAIDFFQLNQLNNLKLKISSEIQIGLIGPIALGKEIQTGIHRATHNSLPHGWEYQIQNDFLINYQVRLDKQLLSYKSLFALNGIGQLKLGTAQSNLVVGLDLSLGHKNNLYSEKRNKFQYFIYGQSQLKIVGNDASLMGGVFNRSSIYTLPYSSMNKIVAEEHVGIVFQFPHVYFGADFCWITKEFASGKTHSWGGLRLGFY